MSAASDVRTFLLDHLRDEARTFWGERNTAYLERVADDWLDATGRSGSQYRIDRIRSLAGSCSTLLDLGAGCGTFVRYALRLGFDAWGVEPQQWKRSVAEHVLRCDGAPQQVVRGVGEQLPFDDDRFDCVTTFQTLEHVQNLEKCCAEMVRVTRPGGGIYIRCPDYALSTYEGHYRLPWLPGMWGERAERYLRWCGRPLTGFRSLQPVSARLLRDLFTSIGKKSGIVLTCCNVDYFRIRDKLHLPEHPLVRGLSGPLFIAHYLRLLLRAEYPVHLYVRIGKKLPSQNSH